MGLGWGTKDHHDKRKRPVVTPNAISRRRLLIIKSVMMPLWFKFARSLLVFVLVRLLRTGYSGTLRDGRSVPAAYSISESVRIDFPPVSNIAATIS